MMFKYHGFQKCFSLNFQFHRRDPTTQNSIFDQKILEVADIKIGTGHLHQNVSYHDKVPGLPGPGRSRDDTSYHVPWLDFWLQVHKK